MPPTRPHTTHPKTSNTNYALGETFNKCPCLTNQSITWVRQGECVLPCFQSLLCMSQGLYIYIYIYTYIYIYIYIYLYPFGTLFPFCVPPSFGFGSVLSFLFLSHLSRNTACLPCQLQRRRMTWEFWSNVCNALHRYILYQNCWQQEWTKWGVYHAWTGLVCALVLGSHAWLSMFWVVCWPICPLAVGHSYLFGFPCTPIRFWFWIWDRTSEQILGG